MKHGDVLGYASYTIDGIEYKTDLVASHAVEQSKLFFYLLDVGIAVLLLILIYFVFLRKKKCKFYEFKGF